MVFFLHVQISQIKYYQIWSFVVFFYNGNIVTRLLQSENVLQ
jgi:hypothetical protein